MQLSLLQNMLITSRDFNHKKKVYIYKIN